MSKLLRLSVSTAVLMSLFAAQTSAVIVVRDTWLDATRIDPASGAGYSEQGTDADTDGDIESVWYRSGTGSSTTMSVGNMRNAAGAASSMSLTTYFTKPGAPVTLANVGDSIVVTWVFKPNTVTTSSTGNQDMRIALVNSVTRLTTDATPASQVFSGYGSFWNMKAATLGNVNPFRIMEWSVAGGANNLLSSAAAWTQDATTTAVVNSTPGFTSGAQYTFTMSVTKTAAGADISQSVAGGTLDSGAFSLTYSDTTPQPLIFDTLGMRPQTPELTATSFDTTMFQVEFIAGTAIPEPALLPVLAAGLLGLTAVVRRRLR